ncbi:hypothetical protein BH24ACT5_BH24ACT5_04810 [soil metagenome]
MARQRSHELALSDGELVVARETSDELHDDLYVLACAVNDTHTDLEAMGERPDAIELRRILAWLLEAAAPLRDREIQPASL